MYRAEANALVQETNNIFVNEIRAVELQYYHNLVFTMSTQAALLGGFVYGNYTQPFGSLVEGGGNINFTANRLKLVNGLFWSTSGVCVALAVHVVVTAMSLQIMHEGLSLYGPVGSVVRGTIGMKAEQPHLFYSFGLFMIFFILSTVTSYWHYWRIYATFSWERDEFYGEEDQGSSSGSRSSQENWGDSIGNMHDNYRAPAVYRIRQGRIKRTNTQPTRNSRSSNSSDETSPGVHIRHPYEEEIDTSNSSNPDKKSPWEPSWNIYPDRRQRQSRDTNPQHHQHRMASGDGRGTSNLSGVSSLSNTSGNSQNNNTSGGHSIASLSVSPPPPPKGSGIRLVDFFMRNTRKKQQQKRRSKEGSPPGGVKLSPR